jgi:nucleoside-diphosphate-sugar epimerase
MRVLIVGCGYVGLPLGAALVGQGHQVVGIRRVAGGEVAMREAGMEPWIGDITADSIALPEGRFDAVVFSASAGVTATAAVTRVLQVEAMARLVAHVAKEPPKRFIFAGSKAVYGQQDGSLVKETSITKPEGARAQVWVEAEQWLLGAGKVVSPVVLRLGDIYGPGRELFVEDFAKNRLKIRGQGQRHLNMIHRDDAVGVILAALKNGRAGEVYNAVDDEPIRETQFFSWLAETMGKWLPPTGPEESDPVRRQELANCKVSNRRLTMELGYRLKYPNFRQGYTAEIKRMTDDGSLEIVPEDR